VDFFTMDGHIIRRFYADTDLAAMLAENGDPDTVTNRD